MEQAQPLNSTHQFSILKRILLFINVAAFRVNKGTSGDSSIRRDTWTTPVLIASITDYIFIKYVFQLPANYHWPVFIGCAVVHSVIELFFSKSIVVIAGNFNTYYNKYLFYLYIALMVFAFGGCLIIFNNEIGHVARGTHWTYHGF